MGKNFNPFKPEFLLLKNRDKEDNREQGFSNFSEYPLEGLLKQTDVPMEDSRKK